MSESVRVPEQLTAAAIDFGGTNIDVLLRREGVFHRYFYRSGREMNVGLVHDVLGQSGILDIRALEWLAVTGGRHRELPDTIDGVPVIKVPELHAVARGGQLASGLDEALVASLGTGTMIAGVRGSHIQHLGGTGVGGGTLLGLSRLLLGTANALKVDHLAREGDAGRIDLTVGDIVGGPVGMIPPDATASHFGKASGIVAGTWVGDESQVGREDVAAALMNLVGQAVLRLALLAAAANGYRSVVLLGHLADLQGIQRAAGEIGRLFGGHIIVPPYPGHGIALGALAEASAAVGV